MRSVVCVLWLAGSMMAADSAVEGPKIGYINSAAGVRGVLGSVGAARLTGPLTGELKDAVVLPGKAAVISPHPDGSLVKIDLSDGAVVSLGIVKAESFVVSPSGSAIASGADGRIRVVSAEGEQQVEFASPGTPIHMAVADSGKAVTVGVAEDGGEALYLLSAQGSTRIAQSEGLVGVAFVPGSTTAFVAARNGEISILSGEAQLSRLTAVEGVRSIAAVSQDRALVVANRALALITRDGATVSKVECACEPSMARPLGDRRFQLTAGVDGPIWLVDASSSELRVAFVPEAVNE